MTASLREDWLGPIADVLSTADWALLKSEARIQEWTSHGPVFERGDDARSYDLVLTGTIDLLDEDRNIVSVVGPGEFIRPDIPLLRRRWPLGARARAGTRLLQLPTEALERALARDASVRRYVERVFEVGALRRFRSQLLSGGVPRAAVVQLVLRMEDVALEGGETLCQEGKPLRGVVLVERGTIDATRDTDGRGLLVSPIGQGNTIGLASLLENEPLEATHVARTPSKVLRLRREDALSIANEHPMLLDYLRVVGGREGNRERLEDPEPRPNPTTPVAEFRKADGLLEHEWSEPVWIAQHDKMDCGAACMAMVAHTYGRRIDMAFYQSMIQVSRDGASMWSLLRAAIATGFEATGVSIGLSALAEMYLPAIVLKKFHFMVVFEVHEEYVLIGDPSRGLERVPRSTFSKDWSGTALLLKPTEELFTQPETRAHDKFLRLLRGG